MANKITQMYDCGATNRGGQICTLPAEHDGQHNWLKPLDVVDDRLACDVCGGRDNVEPQPAGDGWNTLRCPEHPVGHALVTRLESEA